jgi:putative ATP-grasp target RiPP
MSNTVLERFADDPVASHSGQFPLGRAAEVIDICSPSPIGIRPWVLGGMRPAVHQGDPVRETFFYDHGQQIAVSREGAPLTIAAATANKVTSNDGDEGPSEDFTYDYSPDSPYSA